MLEWEALWTGQPRVKSPTMDMSSTSHRLRPSSWKKPELCMRSDSKTIAAHGWETLWPWIGRRLSMQAQVDRVRATITKTIRFTDHVLAYPVRKDSSPQS